MEYKFTDTILKVTDVSLTLGGNKILRDINLEIKDVVRPNVEQGQVVSLLAPSGVGKTQLLKIMAGLNTPDTGEVLVNVEQKPVKQGQVGVVQQNYPLWDHRTVLGNLKRAGNRLPKGERNEKIGAYLDHFGLTDKKDLWPCQLSGGQRQRVAIAQALLSAGHFILLDEPFSGLDINMIDKVSEMIVNISTLHELNTIIIVSHDIVSTSAISDTLWLMGKEKNPDGTWIEGATIKEQYDLMASGLAWRKDIRNVPEFNNMIKDINLKFKSLA